MSYTIRLTILMLAFSLVAQAQTFSSGSNGSDGALNLTTPGTVDFDPVALGLDTDGDNVYHFTTITIASGVTVKFAEKRMRRKGSIVWLATGAVQISGTLDLSGGDGHPAGNQNLGAQAFSEPGPGGYAGGLGGTQIDSPTSGRGPGGGQSGGCGAAHASNSLCGNPPAYGNLVLIPLRGGSGGGGAGAAAGNISGSGGGAGAGAIRIASSTSIAIGGAIVAIGGNGGTPNTGGIRGGSGSGGAIHIIAPVVTGAGTLNVSGTGTGGAAGSFGRIRIEAFTQSFTGTFVPSNVGPQFGTPYQLPVTAVAPSGTVRITSVGGVAVPPSPTASFTAPDVSISQSGSVTVGIEASNIPLGKTVTLQIMTEGAGGNAVTSTPLAGTVALSTATATITFPPGFSKGWIVATW